MDALHDASNTEEGDEGPPGDVTVVGDASGWAAWAISTSDFKKDLLEQRLGDTRMN